MISPNATIAEISEYLQAPTSRLSLDYGRIWGGDVRVICFADRHVPHAFKDEYIRALPELKHLGLTHLAFELLSVDQQPLLDEYFASAAKDATMRSKLVEHFNYVWGGDGDDDGGLLRMAEKLTRMIDATIEQGVQVVAMEPPLPHPFREGDGYFFVHDGLERLPESLQESFDAFWNPRSSVSAILASADEMTQSLLEAPPPVSPMNVFPTNVTPMNSSPPKALWNTERAQRFVQYLNTMRTANPPPPMQGLTIPRPRECYAEAVLDKPWGDIIDHWRDAHWMRALKTALHQKNSRILAFAGAGHFGYETEHSNINELLARAGYRSVVVGFAGGDSCIAPQPEDALDVRLMSAASELGFKQQIFAVPIASESPRDCDWIVHIVVPTSDP